MPVEVYIAMIIVLVAALLYLGVRLLVLKSAAKRIAERLDFVLEEDTNIGIDFETSEKNLKRLVTSLNRDIGRLNKLKAEYRNRDIELREAISNISHDLRTPLTVINSYVNLIERSDKALTPKTQEALTVIKGKVDTMVALIEELFTYSLCESEQAALEMTEVCVNDCLERCLTEFYSIINESGIDVSIDITSTPIKRRLNSKAFGRILENVLGNAVKYTEGDLSVTLSESGEMTFSNTASKLDVVAVGKLFNRFFTVEDGEASTGLGLSIAKVLTERMNGKITAELIEGKLFIRLSF